MQHSPINSSFTALAFSHMIESRGLTRPCDALGNDALGRICKRRVISGRGGTGMDFDQSQKVKKLVTQIDAFMEEHIYPIEAEEHWWNAVEANRWTPSSEARRVRTEGGRRCRSGGSR